MRVCRPGEPSTCSRPSSSGSVSASAVDAEDEEELLSPSASAMGVCNGVIAPPPAAAATPPASPAIASVASGSPAGVAGGDVAAGGTKHTQQEEAIGGHGA